MSTTSRDTALTVSTPWLAAESVVMPPPKKTTKEADKVVGKEADEVLRKEPDNDDVQKELDKKTLATHYLAEGKRGIVLTKQDLVAWAKKQGLKFKIKDFGELRNQFKYMAIHAKWKKPAHYMTSIFETIHNCQVSDFFVCFIILPCLFSLFWFFSRLT